MKKIPVKLGDASYDVLIEHGLLARVGLGVRDLLPDVSRCVIITGRKIEKLWGQMLASSLRQARLPFTTFSIPDGEKHKNIHTVETLLKQMAAAHVDRRSVVIALGGGVVGDIAGFVASIYMRGVPVIQVPTTLLAQVDASIGGKTGVNLPAGKNLVGAFHQPSAVFIDPGVLSTLPKRESRAGFFEVIKCGVIRDSRLFRTLEAQSSEAVPKNDLLNAIAASVKVKADIVSHDEREGDLRRILNFGHTIGHALETEGGYRQLLHGEAVGWGMIAAAKLGEEVGVTPASVARRIESTVLRHGPLPVLTSKPANVLRLIQADKKTLNGTPHFVLATSIGKTKISNNIPASAIRSSVEYINRMSRSQ